MVKTCTAPPLALNIFDLISTINKVLYNKLNYTCRTGVNYLNEKCVNTMEIIVPV